MDRIIGKCGKCGGNVTTPTIWHGVHPPTPSCVVCGAHVKSSLPVLPMEESVEPKKDLLLEDWKRPKPVFYKLGF